MEASPAPAYLRIAAALRVRPELARRDPVAQRRGDPQVSRCRRGLPELRLR